MPHSHPIRLPVGGPSLHCSATIPPTTPLVHPHSPEMYPEAVARRYQLLGEIARGSGMGVVLEGRDPGLRTRPRRQGAPVRTRHAARSGTTVRGRGPGRRAVTASGRRSGSRSRSIRRRTAVLRHEAGQGLYPRRRIGPACNSGRRPGKVPPEIPPGVPDDRLFPL